MDYVPHHRPMFGQMPPTAAERWRLVEEFIDVWYGPLGPGDGFSDTALADVGNCLGFALPEALRNWYRLAGNREDIWSRQDHLALPYELAMDRIDGQSLIVRWENQGCEVWGIQRSDLDKDDPPIFELGSKKLSNPTTTAFAIQVMLAESY